MINNRPAIVVKKGKVVSFLEVSLPVVNIIDKPIMTGTAIPYIAAWIMALYSLPSI